MAHFAKRPGFQGTEWDDANYRVTLTLGRNVPVRLLGGGPSGEKLVIALTPAFPQIVTLSNPSIIAPHTQEVILRGTIVGEGQLDAFVTKGTNRIPYSSPLKVAVRASLGAAVDASAKGLVLRLISSTASIAGFGSALRWLEYDRTESVSGIGDLCSRMQIIANREKRFVSRLDIVGHGSTDSLTIGNDTLMIVNTSRYASLFNELQHYFRQGSYVVLIGCEVGGNENFMRRLAGMIGVPVWASIGLANPGGVSDSGRYAKCEPDGRYVITSIKP